MLQCSNATMMMSKFIIDTLNVSRQSSQSFDSGCTLLIRGLAEGTELQAVYWHR